MGAGRTRFIRGPSLTYASLTNNRSTSISSLRLVALAMALSRTLTTVGAMRLLVVRSVVRAFSTCWPRIRSTTSRAFCGETRMYRASAFTLLLSAAMTIPLCRFRGLLRGGGLHRVPLELAGGREFAELVSHHILGDIHGDEFFPVVQRDGVAHELGKDGAAARPRAHDLLFIGRGHHRQPGFQVGVGKRSLLYASAHGCLYLFLLFRLTIHLSVRLLLRVLKPRVGWPHGVTGWRPPLVSPSPPPCG